MRFSTYLLVAAVLFVGAASSAARHKGGDGTDTLPGISEKTKGMHKLDRRALDRIQPGSIAPSPMAPRCLSRRGKPGIP